MPRRLAVLLLSFAGLASACIKEAATPEAPTGTGGSAAAAGGTEVAELPLVADVPAGAQPNAGAPGFYSSDDRISVLVREATDDVTRIAEKRKALEAFGFKSWISADTTQDGWSLRYAGLSVDMSGAESTNYRYEVRRTLGGKAYNCYGSVKKKEDIEANLKICQSLRAK